MRWINAALRSVVWLGAAFWWAYLKKPEGGGLFDVRSDAVGWLGMILLVGGLILHLWSNLSLVQGERSPLHAPVGLVARGPYRYVRNPIYIAGAPIFVGINLLYSQWNRADLLAAVIVATAFHVMVIRREEPALRKRFGAAYEEYCRRVPRWIPSLLRVCR
jgi:protein-S-isoprenylcysteine O-methyltransferase Ste14